MGSQRTQIITCHFCGHENLAGSLICEKCGSLLATKEVRTGTRNLVDEMPEFIANSVFTTAGTGRFEETMVVRIDIDDYAADITANPARRDLLLGRRDPNARIRPEVDLEDYNGYKNGVSRKHALIALRDHELTLQDQGSANGTFLNGVRLPPHRAHKLHDGDEIRLGRLRMRVYFHDIS